MVVLVAILLLIIWLGLTKASKPTRKALLRSAAAMAVLFVVGVIVVIVAIFSELRYDKKDLEFTPAQLALIDHFKINDTFCFQNATGIRDTFYVDSITNDRKAEPGVFMAAPAYAHREVVLTRTSEPGADHVLRISAFPQAKERDAWLSLGSFEYSFNDTSREHVDTITLNGVLLKDIVVLRNKYPARATRAHDMVTVFWTDKDGILAYETMNGRYWLRQ